MNSAWIPVTIAALISGILAVQSPTLGRALLAVDPVNDVLRATATPPTLITVTPSPTDDGTRITMTPIPTPKPILTPIGPILTTVVPILTPIGPILTPHITPVAFIYMPVTMQK